MDVLVKILVIKAETCSLIQLSDNNDVLDGLNVLYCYNTSG
jgi:hypothetical protein